MANHTRERLIVGNNGGRGSLGVRVNTWIGWYKLVDGVLMGGRKSSWESSTAKEVKNKTVGRDEREGAGGYSRALHGRGGGGNQKHGEDAVQSGAPWERKAAKTTVRLTRGHGICRWSGPADQASDRLCHCNTQHALGRPKSEGGDRAMAVDSGRVCGSSANPQRTISLLAGRGKP